MQHRRYYYNSYLGESSWTPPPGSHLHTKHAAALKRVQASAADAHHQQPTSEKADAGDPSSRRQGGGEESKEGVGGHSKGDNAAKYDYTGRAARKDFLSFLGNMVTSAKKAHDTAESLHRRAIAKRARAFISGKMNAHEAHKAFDSFWQSVDAVTNKENQRDSSGVFVRVLYVQTHTVFLAVGWLW